MTNSRPLLSDSTLRRKLGKSAKERALSAFDEGPVIDQYEALYERVLAPAKSIVDLHSKTS